MNYEYKNFNEWLDFVKKQALQRINFRKEREQRKYEDELRELENSLNIMPPIHEYCNYSTKKEYQEKMKSIIEEHKKRHEDDLKLLKFTSFTPNYLLIILHYDNKKFNLLEHDPKKKLLEIINIYAFDINQFFIIFQIIRANKEVTGLYRAHFPFGGEIKLYLNKLKPIIEYHNIEHDTPMDILLPAHYQLQWLNHYLTETLSLKDKILIKDLLDFVTMNTDKYDKRIRKTEKSKKLFKSYSEKIDEIL